MTRNTALDAEGRESMKYKIDKGVPQPVRYQRNLFPLSKMEPDDSFFVSAPSDGEKMLIAQRIRWQAKRYQERENQRAKFTVRHVEGGVRTWRIK